MTTTKHNPAIQKLDFTPTCVVGHPGEFQEGRHQPCTAPADYYTEYHVCEGLTAQYGAAAGTGHVLWCSHHLARYTTALQDAIDQALEVGGELRCDACHHTGNTIPDWLWAVTSIK